MFNVLIDTSVWLDLAEDQNQTPLLSVVEDLIKDGLMNLIVPSTVITEFRKNRNRVAKSSAKSLSTHFEFVKDAIRKAATAGLACRQPNTIRCRASARTRVAACIWPKVLTC